MAKRTYPLNEYGYVTTWLISGRLDTPVDPALRPPDMNQFVYESEEKKNTYNDNMKKPPERIEFGAPGISEALPWRIYESGPNAFVDLTHFYHVIYRCEFWAATSIVSPCDQTVEADIWNYPSYDAWLNGEHVSVYPICVYAPMKRNRVRLSLKKGENVFFLRAMNACTRDTRNIVALSFPDLPDIRVAYPGKENELLTAQRDLLDWVSSIRWNGESLVAPTDIPSGATVTVNGAGVNGREYAVSPRYSDAKICVSLDGFSITRTVEICERRIPAKKIDWSSAEEERAAFLDTLAECKVPENSTYSQHFFNTYSRLCKGYPLDENDVGVIRVCLKESDMHQDCSDFRMSYILAAVKRGLIPDYLVEEIRKTAINYSYWHDEKSVGAMCYGTENHSLLFFSCQLLAGMLWPSDVFVNSGRTGEEQVKVASERIDAWLKRRETNGFEEFMSGGYTPITVAAMLLVVDFARDDLSERCARLIDRIFYDLARNSFDGVVYAPQGRIYRGVITPWGEGTQMLLYFATGSASPTGNTGIRRNGNWISAFAKTKYTFPSDLEDCMRQKGMFYTKVEGTRIQTFKGENFMLTSLPLEYVDGECFGKYKPGSIGYQQHLSYATVGGACHVYPQHPGLSYDGSSIRPGYWFGNGIFPAQKQWDNLIGYVFPLIDDHPICYTHLYFPSRCFDEWEQDGSWLFGRHGEGYVAVWCSRKLTLFDGDVTQGCDFRAEKGAAAYFTALGDSSENGSFEEFKKYAKDFSPKFDTESLVLTTEKGHRIGGEFAPDEIKFRITF